MSKRSSPRKDVNANAKEIEKEIEKDKLNDVNVSEIVEDGGDNVKSTGTKLKLRLKVTETAGTTGTTSTNTTTNTNANNIPKIKLNFSRSNESFESSSGDTITKPSGKRGRPKKDKSAVLAAAIAASQPNEAESEERKSRRRAAEEKIKKSVDGNVIVGVNETGSEEMGSGRKRRNNRDNADTGDVTADNTKRRRKVEAFRHSSSASSSESIGKSEFVDITDASQNQPAPVITSTPTFINPHENEFIQRSKTFLNISLQHDTFLYTASLGNPMEVEKFKSVEDAVEKLVAFHVGIGAGQFSKDELVNTAISRFPLDHENTFNVLQDRYKSIVQSHAAKKVPTELLLLEQRLCLEEEKFLLVKLKNEYAARFLKTSGSGSASASGLGSAMNSAMGSSMSSVTLSNGSSRPSTPSGKDK